MFDNHTHTNYSIDSKMKAEESVESALRLGLEGIAITDHIDFDYPNEIFDFDILEYSNFIDNLKLKYSDSLQILKGIEIGVQPQVKDKNIELAAKVDFDFIIGSVHVIDGMDPYTGSYFTGKTKEEAYTRYLEAIYEGMLSFNNYDVIGHIGYVRRYGNIIDRSMDYKDYQDILDKILKKVVEQGKGIEINTSGLRGILKCTIPDEPILQRYRELGGQIITIGSDAHVPEHIGANFSEAMELLKKLGYKYTCHFVKRKPVFEKI